VKDLLEANVIIIIIIASREDEMNEVSTMTSYEVISEVSEEI
jgi:hypothetical protein